MTNKTIPVQIFNNGVWQELEIQMLLMIITERSTAGNSLNSGKLHNKACKVMNGRAEELLFFEGHGGCINISMLIYVNISMLT